jgi:hypothetical protein
LKYCIWADLLLKGISDDKISEYSSDEDSPADND